jgi:hypothetical protein
MLIALYTIFVLSGGGSFGPMVFIDEALDSAKIVIVEDDRRKEATVALKAMNKRSSEYTKATKKLAKDLGPDTDDRDVSDEELDVFWDKIITLNSEYSNDLVNMRFQLRDQLSREEWEGLFPVQKSANDS